MSVFTNPLGTINVKAIWGHAQ